MSTSNGHLPQWGPAKPEDDVPGSVSFTGTLHSGVRGKPTQLSQGCEGPGKPEGDVPGSVSFTDTLPSGVRGKSKQLSQGCEGPEKPEGDVPGSVSFTGTLPSGVGATPGAGATQGVRAPGRESPRAGLELAGEDPGHKKPEGGCLPVNNIFKDFAGYAIPAQGIRGSE